MQESTERTGSSRRCPGTYECIGKPVGARRGLPRFFDARTFGWEGEIDLAARSWKGKVFEKR